MKGFSERNLVYMQTFAAAYPQLLSITQQPAAKIQTSDDQPIVFTQQDVAQLPWGHHQVILDKVHHPGERLFYIRECGKNAWSRAVLLRQIESNLYKRQGALTSNFSLTLPAYDSDLARQMFKDPYQLDFIMLSTQARERDLENALIQNITHVLLELGEGFSFMGRQKKMMAGDREFYIDLLFYHTRLRRYVIIDLKIGEFEPEFVSKMNLYLGLADDTSGRV